MLKQSKQGLKLKLKLQDSSDSDNCSEQLESTPLIERFSFLDRPRGSGVARPGPTRACALP